MVIYDHCHCGIIQASGIVFVSTQFFSDLWGRYFVGKLYDVTMEDNSFVCIWFIYKDNFIWFGCKLKIELYFLLTHRCPVIVVIQGSDTIKGSYERVGLKNNYHI